MSVSRNQTELSLAEKRNTTGSNSTYIDILKK